MSKRAALGEPATASIFSVMRRGDVVAHEKPFHKRIQKITSQKEKEVLAVGFFWFSFY